MMTLPCVLVTGGLGYIGSHTVVELLTSANYSVIVADNLANSNREVLHRIEDLTGCSPPFYDCDITDKDQVMKIFQEHSVWCVIHFAGLKAVSESCSLPLMYYKTNINCLLTLTEVMDEFDVRNVIFSSSATVYGDAEYLPIDERHPVGKCANPYGRTKYFQEEILKDLVRSDERWNVINLRYFNPAGAHSSGSMGEDPRGTPNNLMPYVSQVALGTRTHVNVFGDDYDTDDGTGVRDYIHVMDLASGHTAALAKFKDNPGYKVYNLGTGRPYSVLQVIKAYERAGDIEIPYKVTERRPGDTANVYADPSLAERELQWKALKDLDEMCQDAWRWQSNNPDGYRVKTSADSVT